MKNKRQSAILNLIENNVINTQEEILAHLRKQGFAVTQATVSRDIRELKIAKVTSDSGTVRYSVAHHMPAPRATALGLNSSLTESILKIDYAQNDIVIHTMPGLAQAIAATIDSLHIHNVLGCVAGDDTILIITRSEESAVEICRSLIDMLKRK